MKLVSANVSLSFKFIIICFMQTNLNSKLLCQSHFFGVHNNDKCFIIFGLIERLLLIYITNSTATYKRIFLLICAMQPEHF